MKQIKSTFFPFLLVFYEIACYLSNDMYLSAIPDLMQDLQLSGKQAQFTLTVWFLGLAGMPLFLAAISDKFGRRVVLLNGGFIYVLSTIICAITSNYSIFLVARFIEGGMASSMMVAGYAAIHESYDHKAAIRILAIMGSISIMAPALGPLFGGILLLFTSWRVIFWLIAIWAFIAILLLMKWMPETLSKEKSNKINITNLFKTYKNILLNPNFMLLMCILGCFFAGFITWITAGPLLVIKYFHYSPTFFGILQAIVFGFYIIGNALVNKLLDKIEVNNLIKIGMFIVFLGCLLISIVTLLFPFSLLCFVAALLIFSFGTGLCFAPLNRTIIEASDEPMGSRVALFTIFLTFFAAIGSGVAGIYFNGTLLSLAMIMGCFTFIAFLIKIGLSIKYSF